MSRQIQKKKRKKVLKNNPLNTKVRLGTYLLCLFLTFLSSLFALALWLLVGLRVALSSGNVSSFLESKEFLDRHSSEALHVMVCKWLKQLLDQHFGKALLAVLIVSLLLFLLLWLASKKNSYVLAKFTAASFCSAGILLITGSLACIFLGVPGSVTLLNAQNTQLFRGYLRSSLFILVAFGVALLAFAFVTEFMAASIARKRRQIYLSNRPE